MLQFSTRRRNTSIIDRRRKSNATMPTHDNRGERQEMRDFRLSLMMDPRGIRSIRTIGHGKAKYDTNTNNDDDDLHMPVVHSCKSLVIY